MDRILALLTLAFAQERGLILFDNHKNLDIKGDEVSFSQV